MQVPSTSSSPDTFVRAGVAHEAVVAADPETAHLFAGMKSADDRVRGEDARRSQARENAVAKLALRDRADFELDQAVRKLELDALAAVGRDRTKSPYRELFLRGLTAIIAAPVPDEIQFVKTLESRVREIASLSAHAEPLRIARERLEGAVAAHADAARAEAEASGALELAKIDWQRQYRANYGALLVLFGDRRKAESYFIRVRNSGAAETDDTGETPAAPTPTPA
jgi:hypothetical protein